MEFLFGGLGCTIIGYIIGYFIDRHRIKKARDENKELKGFLSELGENQQAAGEQLKELTESVQ